MSKQVKVPDEVHAALMGARMEGETAADVIARLLNSKQTDEADRLLEELDNPKVDPILAGLPMGELPECCQGIYDDPEHPIPTCPHWEKAWVNHYGNRIVHYRNKLTGGSYFDYFNKYVGA